MTREVVSVPFGSGLDRATGALATDQGQFTDLQNVILKEAKLEVRQGMTAMPQPFSGVTDIVGIFPFRAIKGGVAVGYNRTTRLLTVWKLDGSGAVLGQIGDWDTLLEGGSLPLVSGAEGKGKLFLAHDEPLYNLRAQTVYYDPTVVGGLVPAEIGLVPLTADFNGDTVQEAVHFRGVHTYLAYMWGWGHGVATRPNAPEVVRFSEGANPTVWPKQHYILCGAADEAITNIGGAGSVLLICKAAETFQIFGDNPQNFGIRPVEQVHGTLNARLGVEFGGAFYYWSETGPRVSTGGISTDLGIPLDLDAPEPAALTAAGEDRYGWCVYDPLRRLILWGFPVLTAASATTRVYALSLRDPTLYRWSYFELGADIYSAGIVTLGAPIVGTEITAWASNVSALDTGTSGTGRKVDISWTNNALIGGERVLFWRRIEGGEWESATAAVVNTYATGAAQTITVLSPPWQALADYEFAVSYMKDYAVTPGFEGDPDNWTNAHAAAGKGTVITSCAAPVITDASWSRLSADTMQVLFTATLGETGIQFDLEETTEPVAAWSQVKTWVEPSYPADNRPALLVYNPTIDKIDSYRNYRMRAERDGKYSAYSNIWLMWQGPVEPPSVTSWVFQNTATNTFLVFIKEQPANGISYCMIEVEARQQSGTWERVYLGGGGASPVAMPIEDLDSPATFDNVVKTGVRSRTALSVGGVWDWGPWSAEELILLTNEACPATPAAFTGVTYSPSDIDVSFAAGGAVGRLMYYRTSLPLLLPEHYSLIEVDGAATGTNFGDLGHYPPGEQQGRISSVGALVSLGQLDGYDYNYGLVTGVQSPPEAVASWAINRTGSRAKISTTPRADQIPKALSNPPNGISVTKEGKGRLKVQWTNNRPTAYRTFVQVLWVGALADVCNPLGPPVLYSGFQLVGPSSGYAVLPNVPTNIVVRIWQSELMPWLTGTWEVFTTYVDTAHTMS